MEHEVILYDVYPSDGMVLFEQAATRQPQLSNTRRATEQRADGHQAFQ
jgi:hypothetical protein